MIRDANAADWAPAGPYDVCVVGAGPAGITLALRLAAAGRRVALLEGGGREFTAESQDAYAGDITGHDYYPLEAPRLRYLGGTTGHWGGQCLQLDDFDFEPRPHVPLSGWPIRATDLAPFRAPAEDLLGTGRFGDSLRRPLDDSGVVDRVEQRWSADRAFHDLGSNEPVRFGTRFAADLAAQPGIDLALNANLVGFDLDGATGRITAARVAAYDGPRPAVAADRFVLATGAMENVRHLLHLNDAAGDRFGNQGGMVGRCFMEHPVVRHGAYFITRRLYTHSPTWEVERLWRRAVPEEVVGTSAAYQREKGILNATVRLNRLHRRPLKEEEIGTSDFVRGLRFDEDYFFVGTTWAVSEQAPNPDSRLVLTEATDRFGMRRLALDWRLTDLEIETLRETTLAAAAWLVRSGLGRMQIEPTLWDRDLPTEIDYSSHHMGGARMSDTPETGVVDADCKVHGAANLYVAGSAVFPTSGHANPTFSIVQLALRLADHLAGAA